MYVLKLPIFIVFGLLVSCDSSTETISIANKHEINRPSVPNKKDYPINRIASIENKRELNSRKKLKRAESTIQNREALSQAPTFLYEENNTKHYFSDSSTLEESLSSIYSELDVYEIPPEDEGLEVLLVLIKSNPDPMIRAAAVAQLDDAESFVATEAAVLALQDSSPEVVLQALDTLEFIGDESVVRYIEEILDHPSENIRKTAEEAIDFLN